MSRAQPLTSLVLFLVAAALPVAVGPRPDGVVRAAEWPAQIRATLHSATVFGSAEPGTLVMATLKEAGYRGAVRADGQSLADESGEYKIGLVDGLGNPVRAVPGDRLLVVVGSAPAADILLPDMSAVPDVAADEVSGVTLPNAPILVTVTAPGRIEVATSADAAGRYTATFGGQFDITPGTTGKMTVTRTDGHTVAIDWAVPYVTLRLGDPVVSGTGPAGQSVALTASRGGYLLGREERLADEPRASGAANWALTLRDAEGNPAPLQADDWLSVTIADWSLNLRVPLVTAETNAAADFVTGSSPAGYNVQVDLRRQDARFSQAVPTASDGRYVIDLADTWDIQPGDEVAVRPVLAGGHATVLVEQTVVGLTTGLDGGAVGGYALPGASVSATLAGPDGRPHGRAAGSAGSAGRFDLDLLTEAGAAALPSAGDRITVTSGGLVITTTIPVLTVEPDLGAEVVRGQTTPHASLTVRAVPPPWMPGVGLTRIVTATKLGQYEADFSPIMNLRAGTSFEASVSDRRGNETRTGRSAPIVHAQVGGNLVSGFVAPSSSVTVTLSRTDVPLAATSALSKRDGSFDVLLMGGPDEPQPIAAGDEVSVAWSGGRGTPGQATGLIRHTTAGIDGTIDVFGRSISGTGPPGARVFLNLSGLEIAGGTPLLAAEVDITGTYSRSIPSGQGDGTVPAGATAEVGILDARGHRSFVRVVAPYLELTMGSREILGRAAPLSGVDFELSQAGVLVGAATAEPDAFGRFTAVLSPTTTTEATIQFGQRLALRESGGRTTAIEVPALSIELDRAGGVLGGNAPPDAELRLRLYPADRPSVPLTTNADATGAWSVRNADLPTGSSYGIADLTRASARTTVANGHLVAAETGPSSAATPSPTTTATSPAITATPPPPTTTPGAAATATPTAGTSVPPPTATSTPPTPVSRTIYLPITQQRHERASGH